jgi:hypothetical protein
MQNEVKVGPRKPHITFISPITAFPGGIKINVGIILGLGAR